jgi:hypothetical protein
VVQLSNKIEGEIYILLPNADIIMSRLKEIDDDELLVKDFYPSLVIHCGKEYSVISFLMIVL